MGAENFITGKFDGANHAGRHSTLQRLQQAQASYDTYRFGRASAHESGEDPDPYMPEGEGTEIELFVAPPKETPRVEDTFLATWDRIGKFDEDRPQMPSDIYFHAEKCIEEAGEFRDAVVLGDMRAIFGEWADKYINLVQSMQALKLSPSIALIIVNSKLDELEARYPTDVFDGSNGLSYEENYRNAKDKKSW